MNGNASQPDSYIKYTRCAIKSFFSNNSILGYGIGMQSQLCRPIDIFGSKSYLFVVVLACLASYTSSNIISLHQDYCPYWPLLNNWWNQVSPCWHDIDNGITNSIHIVLRSRHYPRTGHGTMLIDDPPQNFQMAHGVSKYDVIYLYAWNCQSA